MEVPSETIASRGLRGNARIVEAEIQFRGQYRLLDWEYRALEHFYGVDTLKTYLKTQKLDQKRRNGLRKYIRLSPVNGAIVHDGLKP